jgi:hypothetical protein
MPDFPPLTTQKASISFRIAGLFTATFAVALILALSFTYVQLRSALALSNRNVISAEMRETVGLFSEGGLQALQNAWATEESRLQDAAFMVRLADAEGNTIFLKPSIQEKKFPFEEVFSKGVLPAKHLGWE